MGCSEIQARIISAILQFLFKNVDTRLYDILSGEVGIHLSHTNNFAIDIAVFDRASLPKNRDKNKYLPVAPLFAFEVDINIEQEEEYLHKKKRKDDFSYMLNKSSRLIASGTQKVIWILTASKIVLVFEKSAEGKIINSHVSWKESFDITIGKTFGVAIEKWIIEGGQEEILEDFK
jgi:Uma2 family endonuclease